MLFNQTIYNQSITAFKLSKRKQSKLLQLINGSVDYWTIPAHLQQLIQNDQKLHNSFTFYTNETNQRDITSKKLSNGEIAAMDQWVKSEYEKCKYKITSAKDVIIESITE